MISIVNLRHRDLQISRSTKVHFYWLTVARVSTEPVLPARTRQSLALLGPTLFRRYVHLIARPDDQAIVGPLPR